VFERVGIEHSRNKMIGRGRAAGHRPPLSRGVDCWPMGRYLENDELDQFAKKTEGRDSGRADFVIIPHTDRWSGCLEEKKWGRRRHGEDGLRKGTARQTSFFFEGN